MPRSEPPRNTGACDAGVYAREDEGADIVLVRGLVVGDVRAQRPGAVDVHGGLAGGEDGGVRRGWFSFTFLEAGVDMKFWIAWNSLRPARDFVELRSPYHLPPFSTAIWPPSAHTMGMAAYHSSPGR